MKGADHVVVNTDTNAFECHHCGARYRPALPCSLIMYLGMSRSFIREHRSCLAPAVSAALSSEDIGDQTPGVIVMNPALQMSRTLDVCGTDGCKVTTSKIEPALPMFLRKQAD